MESRRIDKYHVVNRNVGRTDESEKSGILGGACHSCDVALTVNGSQTVAGEYFDIFGVLNDNCVSSEYTVRGESN